MKGQIVCTGKWLSKEASYTKIKAWIQKYISNGTVRKENIGQTLKRNKPLLITHLFLSIS